MDQKIAQYLNKDTSNVLEKCFETLYESLEKDITLMCVVFKNERSEKPVDILDVEPVTPNKNLKLSENKSEDIHENRGIMDCDLEKIKTRIDLTIKTISDLNVLDQGGTSYLGSGAAFDKKTD